MALFTIGCGGKAEDGGVEGGGGRSAIEVIDARFAPDELTVRWNFTGRLPHAVTGKRSSAAVASERFTGSRAFEYTFQVPGRYNYACGVHTCRMLGVIIVE